MNVDGNADAYAEEKTITTIIIVHNYRRRLPKDDLKNIERGILKFAVVKKEQSLSQKGCICIQSDRWIIVLI